MVPVIVLTLVVAAVAGPVSTARGSDVDDAAGRASRRSAASATAAPDGTDGPLVERLAVGGTARVIAMFAVEGSTRAAAPRELARRGAIAARAHSIANDLRGVSGRASVRRFAGVPAVVATVDAAGLERLAAISGVTSVRADRVFRPQLGRAQLAQSVPRIDAAAAHALGHTGVGEVIAVIDSGVDGTHPMLSGKIAGQACYSTTYAPVGSQSVCPGGVAASDTSGGGPCAAVVLGCEHGTHVAGIAAGRSYDPPGAQPPIAGVAPDAQVHAVQVFSRFNSSNVCFPSPAPCAAAWESDIVAGFDRVLSLSDTVDFAAVNVSIGGDITESSCPNDPAAVAIEGLTDAGVPVVVASGNDGFYDAIAHPSCVPDAIAVAAVNDADDISLFANTSKWLDLLAPGEAIVSAIPGGTASFDGTSMAAPHVAGAITLLREAHPTADVAHLLVALRKGGKPVYDPYSKLTFRRIDVGGALDAYSDDITKPVPTLHWMPALATAPNIAISWSAVDEPGGSGIGRFDVLKRAVRWDGASVGWALAIDDSPATASSPATTPGWTKCYAVRARDVARNQSNWTEERCSASPLDDRALVAATAGWVDGAASTRYLGTMRSTWSPSQRLTRPGIVVRKLWIVATTCPACGKVAVIWNGAIAKVVDLRSATTKHQQLIGVFSSPSARVGTLELLTLDDGLVSIDGVGVSRS
ncbi:MAG TPA: S8 family serine peptidase [Acidimicrobiia bacterium]|nr:S8 family serine peptidase [Acidimicrobiia bacterium]